MKKTYPKFKRFEVEKIFKRLSREEQKLLTDYLFYRQYCGLQNTDELRRRLLQIRDIIECDFKEFKGKKPEDKKNKLTEEQKRAIEQEESLNKHTQLVVLIKNSYLSTSVKKNLKIDLNNFFGEYLFSDWWSAKFKRVYSNKNGKKGDIIKKELLIPTDEEVEKMINTENSTFWKTFLLIQATTGLRTKECRCLEINKIIFNKDNISTIKIHMTKTGNEKVVFTDSQTTFFIKKLIKEYETASGKYLFPSRNNPNIPISKDIVNKWFRKLSMKATGKHLIPYSLRHKKATTLYKLAKENKIAENTALKLLGHSKSQMATYDHTPKEQEIEILKEQAFNIELSPEKKHELEIKVEELTNTIKDLSEGILISFEAFKILKTKLESDNDFKNKKHTLSNEERAVFQKILNKTKKSSYNIL